MNTTATQNAYPKPGQLLDDHPISQIFPMMDKEDRAELEKSVKANGLREAIILLDGHILDGRNRWEACRAVGTEPKFEFYNYRVHGQSPAAYVMDRNLRRRHLTVGQKAAIAAESIPFFAEEAKARQKESGKAHAGNLKSGAKDEHDQTTGHNPEDESQEHKRGGGGGHSHGPRAADPKPAAPAAKKNPAPAKTTPPASATAPTAAPGKKSAPKAPVVPAPTGTAAERAAASTGVSPASVKAAAKLKNEAPGAFADVKAGKVTLNAATAKLSSKQKAQQAYDDAIARIGNVAGKAIVEAHRDGTRLKGKREALAYAALDDAKMIEIRGLIEDGWQVAKALKYKTKSIGRTHSVGDLITRAAQAGGIFSLEIGDWVIEVTRKKARK